MRVAVTGGSGYVGTAVVEELRRCGHEPFCVDVRPPRDSATPHVSTDILDREALTVALADAGAVVHLAAVPAPDRDTDERTLQVNVMGTYAVFAAAAANRIDRVVWASSETVLGVPFEQGEPLYAPIDAAHPVQPETPYALSKVHGEDIGRYFASNHGVASVALRFAMIVHPEDYASFRQDFDDVVGRRWNLWAYVDLRDAALATGLAVDRPLRGAHEAVIAAADTAMDRESAELMREGFPGVPLRREISGHETLLSNDAAAALLDYEPRHSWRDSIAPSAP